MTDDAAFCTLPLHSSVVAMLVGAAGAVAVHFVIECLVCPQDPESGVFGNLDLYKRYSRCSFSFRRLAKVIDGVRAQDQWPEAESLVAVANHVPFEHGIAARKAPSS